MSAVRILQVVNYMDRGGLETMLMNYYRHIDRSKIQLDFLVHRDKVAQYDHEIAQLGGRIYHMPRLNPLSLSYHKKEKDFFQTHKYSVVHCHMDCMSAFPLFHAKSAGVPVRIAHSHSSSQNKDLKYPVKLLCKQLISHSATQLFACSEDAGHFMFGNHYFQIMRNAIELKKFLFNSDVRAEVRKELEIQDEVVLGNVATLKPVKNQLFLLEVFSEYHKMNPNSKLLLVGEGPSRKNIEEKVKNLGLQDRVILTGVRSDVHRLLQAMDVFVFPSLFEGLPVTMVEAQAAGLPCVISDTVPNETDITDLVTRVSLKAPLQQWISAIDVASKTTRADQSVQIKRSGFDIEENAKWLENFYLKVSENG